VRAAKKIQAMVRMVEIPNAVLQLPGGEVFSHLLDAIMVRLTPDP
jgi:hypothetical protein